MKKKIYAVLLLTAVCAGSGVFAQSSAPKENLEKYYTLERIRSKSGWLVSDNAAGLMLNQASLSIAEVNYDFEQGGLRNVTDGAEVNAFGVRTDSYRRCNRLSFYGKLSYDYAASKDRSWAGNANIGDSPMLIGDSIPGNTRDETYAIEAGVAYRMGRWVVGAMGKYEDRSLAKRRDSRNKTTSMYLSVQPGVMFTSKVVDAGLNFTYERSTEQVGYAAFGTNTTSGMIYFFEGMWFYTSQQLGGSEKFYDVYYKGSEYGGAAQLELKLGKRVKFFNQFSAEYGKMERFRFDLDQHLGDNDQLTYRYLGVLNVAGRGVDQRLSVDASWLDAAGADGGVAAAKAGNQVIMTPNTHCYLDYFQTQEPERLEPLGIGGYVPVRKVYSFDPYDRLSSAEQSCIQGVQGNIWTEYIASFAHAQHMALPRLAALAEVGWACDRRDFGDFTRRMTVFRKLYDKCGYRYASYFFDGTGE